MTSDSFGDESSRPFRARMMWGRSVQWLRASLALGACHWLPSLGPSGALLVVLSVVVCLPLVGTAQRRATYTNPVIAGDYPDPSVIRVGDEYFAATTSGTWAPHFPVLRSRDLVNWQTVGYVFTEKPAWVRSDFWAPEIVNDGGRFFVFYTGRRDDGPKKPGTLCVAVATAGAPAGPYTDHGPLVCQIPERGNVGSIDPDFVRDESGAPYLVWKADGNDAEPDQPTSIYAQPLSPDGTKLVGKRREIMRNTEGWEGAVTEGSFILRRGEWFYHFYSGNACCGRGCNYALGVARAKKLLGPWEKNPRNPLVAANKDWQCPGHGSIVSTPDGRDFLLYHSYRQRPDTFNVGREAVLDEVKWGADGWPTINVGRGPSTAGPSPLGVPETDDEAEVFDDFDAPQLGLEWQWPMFVTQTARVDATGGGQLVLETGRGARGDELTTAVLARRTVSGSYVATTRVNARGSTAAAGLAAYSWRDAGVGITLRAGKVFVWRREGQSESMVASTDAPAGDFVQLRMTAAGGEVFRFAYSTDGREWKSLGRDVGGSHVEGAHVALTAGANTPGAAARFDWVQITPKK
jgi:beta-xylosidase